MVLLRNEQAVAFTDEVVEELTKVTWPTRDETVRASTTVVVATLFTAAVLGGYDYLWKQVADLVLFNAG
ncbi:MAG: preprotein translocase subunit SecE [Deltaproteobacteria bacterium]|nr:MAG: preprotein translocase subunit SecE [Deltaproteobacteria bacterium]